jgi:beta-glucosidase-like glycosyl hydrolase
VHQVTATRLKALGVDWNFAPVADVHSEARNPVIGPRSFGSDPAAVSAAVAAALRGLAAGGVAACLKHFPGHGDTRVDSHLALPRSDADAATLEARELAPFRANLAAPSIMTAHVVYAALDADRPATFSRAVTHGLLRERLGYQGIAITDALEMKGAAEGRSAFDAARAALEAGCDLLMFATHDEAVRRVRLELAKALVDERIDRVNFDAARPRLAAFDRTVPEPSAGDLARPLTELTPPDWEHRLTGIAERGLIVRGTLPAAARGRALRVHEPAFAYGPTLRELLAAERVPLAPDSGDAIDVFAVASRVPLPAAELERLRAAARGGPVVLLGLQNDAFLDDVPEAALRVSAADVTPLTRRVVARAVAGIVAATV